MPFRSPHPEVVIPQTSITHHITQFWSEYGNQVAYIDESGKEFTYQFLSEAIKKTAAGLQAKGMAKGDVLCIYTPNHPLYAVAFHAVATIGGILTPANPLYTADELVHQLQTSSASYLLTIPAFMEKAKAAAEKYGKIREMFVFGEAEGATPFSALQNNDGKYQEVSINSKEDVAVMPYSSGTTGLPKGVMLTHFNLIAQVQLLSATFGPSMSHNEHLVAFLPFFHIYSIVVFLCTMLRYGTTIIVVAKFDLVKYLEYLQKFKISWAFIVPPVVVALAKHPVVDKFDLKCLKYVFSAAAPLSKELEEAVRHRLKVEVIQAYGMTEVTGASHLGPLQSLTKYGNAGLLCPNVECRVMDLETRKELGVRQEGEIVLRTPCVMKGYCGNPQATANCWEDGWFKTGDVGYVDEDGYIFIVDRVKELIKYKGFQVAPAELEGLLLKHSDVADVAVIPVPDEEAGELPKAFVVLKEGHNLDGSQLVHFLDSKVAPHKKLRGGVEFVKEIPKSASGKILRRVLVQKEREKHHNK